MIYIDIDGDSDTITILRSIGFELISTQTNPYPQPFFALMELNEMYADAKFIADKTFRDFVYSKISLDINKIYCYNKLV